MTMPDDNATGPPVSPPPLDPGSGWSDSPEEPGDGGDSFRDASRGERIQKVMASAGVGSRRHCEELVLAGEVRVNGTLVNWLPAWVDPSRDHVVVSGDGMPRLAAPVHVLLFKPKGVVCSNDDPGGRRRAIDLVVHPSKARLFPVGRLDLDSSGVLILTNDGELAMRLTHPRHGIRKEYEVTVRGELSDRDIERLQRGILLTGRWRRKRSAVRAMERNRASSIELVHRDRDRTRLKITLAEGRNRQIRRMMAKLGHPVRKLRRLKIGPLTLKGLKPGQWRDLTPRELEQLQRIGND